MAILPFSIQRRRRAKERLSEAQNHRCCYCGIRMMGTGHDDSAPTFEHVVPRYHGGTNDMSNIVIACRKCNNDRGNTPYRTKMRRALMITHAVLP